jgi:hypothetical protein
MVLTLEHFPISIGLPTSETGGETHRSNLKLKVHSIQGLVLVTSLGFAGQIMKQLCCVLTFNSCRNL